MSKKEYVYLNVRVGLLKSTKEKMKKICKEKGSNYTFADLLNETFK